MEIETAFKRLLIKDPYYGLFCLGLPKLITTKVDTMGVARRGIYTELCINPDFWKQYTDNQQIALLKHELGHICFQHMFICNSFSDARTFNIAADCEVNSHIEDLPPNGCFAKDLGLQNGLGTKVYYEALTRNNPSQNQNQQQPPQNSQKPEEDGQDEQDDNQGENNQNNEPQQQEKSEEEKREEKRKEGERKIKEEQYPDYAPKDKAPVDDHSHWKDFQNIPEATKQLIQNNIETLVKSTAEQIEKQRGTIPAEFAEMIQKLREKKPEIFNWKAYFRRMLGSIYDVNIKSTRRKESKRFEGAAGIQHRKKVSILVAVDTSGSVSTKELQDFFSEIDYIFKAGARITLIECDAQINKVVEYDGKNIPEIVGRGGTSFDPPVDYYVKHRKDYASLIYFTDGYCSLPNQRPQGMVWVITSDGNQHQDYPGKSIYIPKEL